MSFSFFLRLTSIIYVFSNIDKFQFFFRIKFLPHLCKHTWGVTLDGVLAFGKGDFIKYLVTSLITRTSPMDIGYHVTYDNLVAKYCTIPLTVFRYLIWVWHGKIIIKIDFYQQKKNHNHFMVDCISCTIHVSGWHSSRKKHASMTGLIWF